ncbi:uncharacterized protein EV420DRAFT_1498497 [Desarmillaria tabescens]|uniref:Uncharacterized protein n=1 Tax=Armillaria tabescens TaxID=1929756 RepID=A0AA39T7N1_ARMTA|nr:uncharacterized protein EV420DRAFT_1498497 [Desarmillaria tabescens]KAK0470126.1 hypothetical protein EV420DRAFT_1498497 [Desarmillaria tabescens]
MSDSDWVPISDASGWPLEVTSLSCLLGPKIPLELANGTFTLTSLRSSALLKEFATLFKSSPGLFGDTNCSSQVLSVLDLILSTVAALRAISEMSTNDIQRPTTLFWSLLLRSLVITCYDKSYILENVSFALPKQPESKCVVLDGHASLLVSHLADNFQPPRGEDVGPTTEEPSSIPEPYVAESNPSHDESSYSPSDEEEPLSDHSDEDLAYESTDISTELTSAPSSNIPLEAHVLSHWRQSDSVALPFLCITDRENIIPLVKSTVYQRYTWGISEPVVGIILSETGCIGRVVIGWVDGSTESDHALPGVRIAYSDERSPDSSLGIYDLTDPVSTIQLAQFILNLRTHVERIASKSSNPTFKPILWRSDSIPLDEDRSGPEERRERRIHIWLRGVPSSQGDSASAHIDPPATAEITKMSLPSKSSKRSASAKSTSQGSLKPPVNTKQRHKSHETSTMSSASTRSKSASTMAKVPEAGITSSDPLSIGSFLSDRNAFSVARLPLIEADAMDPREFLVKEDGPALSYDEKIAIDAAQDEEVTAMAKIYDELTGYQKPLWDTLPSVDVAVQHSLDLLMHQVEKMNLKSDKYATLDPSLMKIVSSSLSFLLCVSMGSFAKGLSYKPNEAEARHCWDFLLYISFVVSGEVVSQRLLLERLLSLPRNTILDLVSDINNAWLRTEERAEAAVRLCTKTYSAVQSQYGPRDLVWKQAYETLDDASKHVVEVVALMQDPGNAAEVIKKRAQEEPDNAKCDSFLAFPLSIPPSTPKRSRPEPLVRGWDNLKPPSSDDHPSQPKIEEKIIHSTPTEEEKRRMKSPFFTNASETKTFKLTQADLEKIVENLLGKHLISVLVGEYKKPDEEDGKAVNQCKMYLVSAVMHLKSLGITRYPVFGLATNGTLGALLCCWYSRRLDRVFIMDRNIRLFDISSPIQAYHFMTFLLRLRRWSDEQLQKHQDRISANANGTFLPDRSWTRKAQKEAAKKELADKKLARGEPDKDADIVAEQFAEMKV